MIRSSLEMGTKARSKLGQDSHHQRALHFKRISSRVAWLQQVLFCKNNGKRKVQMNRVIKFQIATKNKALNLTYSSPTSFEYLIYLGSLFL